MADDNAVWRAQTYALLARLLVAPPNQSLLDNIAAVDVTESQSPMGVAWQQLIDAAKLVKLSAVDDEYQALFIGVTQGELIPYGSYYQTGFLMEEPLAELRTDLARLGLQRQDDKAEPEDHAAAQCDVMRLILTAEGTPVVCARDFYQRHLLPWMERFFQDLQLAKSARFYRAVGTFGSCFIKLETRILTVPVK